MRARPHDGSGGAALIANSTPGRAGRTNPAGTHCLVAPPLHPGRAEMLLCVGRQDEAQCISRSSGGTGSWESATILEILVVPALYYRLQ